MAPLLMYHGRQDTCHTLTSVQRLVAMLQGRGAVHALLVDDEMGHTNCYREEHVKVAHPFLQRALAPGGIDQAQLSALVASIVGGGG